MAHCIDFFQKWKKEPGFCGLSPSAAKQIDRYLDFAEEFAKEYGFDVDLVYRNVPSTAVKSILHFRKDSDVKKKACQAIAQTLRDKHGISGRFVQMVIGVSPQTKKLIEEPRVIVAPLSGPHTETVASNAIKDKIRMITGALTPGQIGILTQVMEKEGLNNEYEAIGRVLVWASERL